MDVQTMKPQSHQEKKGQTLAEFALTLPILLLLLFGIVEFGRLFQSWVTLQNAARTAVRYASTGQYKQDRFNIDEIVVCENGIGVDGTSLRGFDRGLGYPQKVVEMFDENLTANLDETLYANWYSEPVGCEVGPETLQNRRDILRLPSIYEEARRGAAGLLLEPSRVTPTVAGVEEYLYSQFQRPHPDVESLDWFDVVVCSTRPKLHADDETYIIDLDTGLEVADPATDRNRFQLVLDDPQYEPAACILREAPVPDKVGVIPDNGLTPWMDAGGPGERVTVVITFNHRLITPIGLANKVTLQAQRSAINESFRVTNAERALSPSSNPSGGSVVNSPTPDIPDPTDTPPPTATFTVAPTNTEIPATDTPSPFTCDNVDVTFRLVPFSGNRLYIEFSNFNYLPTYLLNSEIHWDKTVVQSSFPNISMRSMSLDTEVYWFGQDEISPTNASDEGNLLYDPGSRDHTIFVPNGGEPVDFQGQFLNGPSLLGDYFNIWDFEGTNFVFDNPESTDPADDCNILLSLPPAPTPTDEPKGNQQTDPTPEPDCASLTIGIEFISLDIAGDVTLRITNDGPSNAPFTGFNIVWPPMSGVGLDRVVFGGRNALDTPENGGDGIVIWDSPLGGGDTSAGTNSETELVFLTDVTIPRYSSSLVHLDFVGVAGKLPISPSDLNGSRFDIWCGTEGTEFGGTSGGDGSSSNNGGTDNSGSIYLASENTPVPTDQPPPTWTPLSETNTPTNTPPPALPTNTFTPAPTVPTNTPTNTPVATNTLTPTPTFSFGGGGVDGGGG